MKIPANKYGDIVTYPKIDIYAKTPNGLHYLCSTNWAKTCKIAKEKYAEKSLSYDACDLVARFAERKR